MSFNWFLKNYWIMSKEEKFFILRSENLCDNWSSYYIHFKPLWKQFTANWNPTTFILSQLSKRKRSANLGKLLKTIKGRKKVFTMVKNQFAFVSFKSLTPLCTSSRLISLRLKFKLLEQLILIHLEFLFVFNSSSQVHRSRLLLSNIVGNATQQ